MHPLKQAIYSSRTADKFVLRLEDGQRDWVSQTAKNNHRSMNAEIISTLKLVQNNPEAWEAFKSCVNQGITEFPELPKNVIIAPGEPWVPYEGMLVTVAPEHDQPFVLTKFTFNGKRELCAQVHDHNKPLPFADLKPFFIK